MPKTYEGYLLIADITGYTKYLTESELEHAQETLTALLELLVENTGPPLIISRLAGDAVISYGLRENFIEGHAFTEMIEDIYVAFRKALDLLVLNNTCGCNACANISSLDLKFFVHYGSFGIQHISDHDELVGSDINLLHRMLKNRVTEVTGFQAYALYSETAIEQLGVEDFGERSIGHVETYEHLGEVKVMVRDMHPVWEEKRDATRVTFPYDKIVGRIEVNINMPPEQVWEYLIQPKYRNIFNGSDNMEIANRVKGKIAPGSVYQCYHGDKVVPQTILEWHPPERMIVKEVAPLFPTTSGITEYRLDEIEGGTRLIKLLAPLTGPFFGRTILNLLMPMFSRVINQAFEDFKIEIEQAYQAHPNK